MQREMMRPEAGLAPGTGRPAQDAPLRELVDEALRHVALAALDGQGAAHGDIVRAAMQRACRAAREGGLPAEQLLKMLKEAWRELPEGRRMLRLHADEVLARAVTLCIDEYYAPVRGRR